ncbi:small subunit of acetolactate synthase-domain-containing protein [Cokeromyces recurvatus]|uniref:small subunit of acetolactate synthase-domain-containing protein n=1 Tax=Cokeromyces recurvatus TaxID=90255 RepID=UPI00221F0601|nr:small subunit of acetolactate synthase-domain-containing protein [Cokeromyces recurvatus]KAI7901332.1 small subunit of acetolactate synthase-domain-containing protein [Cokeromyces recurvatus]
MSIRSLCKSLVQQTRNKVYFVQHQQRVAIQPQQCRFYTPLSTSALAFKDSKEMNDDDHVPISLVTQKRTAEDAVRIILQNTPKSTKDQQQQQQQQKRHVLNLLVQNEPGVLSKLSGILAGRNFNIESLVVASTEVPDLSRMSIVFKGKSNQIEQARKQFEDLVPVWAALDYTNMNIIERELLLIKLSTLGPENVHRQLHMTASKSVNENNTTNHLQNITELTRLFNGKIVDVSTNSVVVEVCAKPNRITSFMKLCAPFGIIEASRTGTMAMPRSPVYNHNDDDDNDPQIEDNTNNAVDPTTLPPG